MRVWASVGAWQNERAGSPSLLSRGAAQRYAACFVSTATAPHASPCLDSRSPRQRRQLPPVLPPCTHPSQRAPRGLLRAWAYARVTRARQALFFFCLHLFTPMP